MKFVIYSTGWDHDIGGVIVLHKLCHHLNTLGYSASIQPKMKAGYPHWLRGLYNLADSLPVRVPGLPAFNRNPALLTPLRPILAPLGEDTVVIYAETVSGNPLRARHVVRWFLHRPGFHDPDCRYGPGEFQVDFNEFLKGYSSAENHVSPHHLFVTHMPTEIYNLDGALPPEQREGAAYCVRKGVFDPGAADLAQAVNIDGLSHGECAAILKRVKYFYSFDPFTAYSSFAALCGAISVVLPPKGMGPDAWYSDETNRYGIAFGAEQEEWARETRHLVLTTLHAKEAETRQSVHAFAEEVCAHFALAS